MWHIGRFVSFCFLLVSFISLDKLLMCAAKGKVYSHRRKEGEAWEYNGWTTGLACYETWQHSGTRNKEWAMVLLSWSFPMAFPQLWETIICFGVLIMRFVPNPVWISECLLPQKYTDIKWNQSEKLNYPNFLTNGDQTDQLLPYIWQAWLEERNFWINEGRTSRFLLH